MLTVYSKARCVQCRFTIKKLDELGVDYEVKDVMQDSEAMRTVKELGYLAAPVVVTPTGEHWHGYRPDRLSQLSEAVAA